MAVEVLTYVYTTEAEVQRVLSATGVDLRVDDLLGDTLSDFWTDITSEATDIINQYCELFYDPSDLYTSHWVRSRARWIGAHLLSQRRGNPALFQSRIDEIYNDLEGVFDGTLIIPRLPTREDVIPSMSNLIVDDRFRVSKTRVHPEISTGETSGRQHLSYYPPTDML